MKQFVSQSILLTLLTTVVLTAPAAAFGECSAVVQRALAQTDQACSQTGRNQACYGYVSVHADPREADDRFTFEQGDIIDLARVTRLRTTSLNEATGEWGIALLRVQANLPDTLPGSNVMFLLFGDAELTQDENAAANPMQMVRLTSGITGVSCDSSSVSGLLIQTPHGSTNSTQRVMLRINGFDVSLGSTVLFEAPATDSLIVTTLDGSAHISSAGVDVLVLPGERVSIDPDSALNPVQRVPLQPAALESLPLLLLDEPIVLPSPVQVVLPPAPTLAPPVQVVPPLVPTAAPPVQIVPPPELPSIPTLEISLPKATSSAR